MKVKNVYPKCYKDEAERREAVKQAYQKMVIKLVLENSRDSADRENLKST